VLFAVAKFSSLQLENLDIKGMGVPSRKHTKSRRNKGRAHFSLKPANFTRCRKCGFFVMPHRVCENCGFYAGKEVVDVLKKLDKKERKKREKVLKEAETHQSSQ
jgi:large subunit ribosomal protein L32